MAESMRGAEILDALYLIIRERQESAAPDSSYTASLMAKGIDKILKKVGEEATELVIAAKGEARHEVVYEAADLLYHVLVLLAFQNISPVEVYSELARRFGMSGLEEKASRTPGK